MAEPSPSTCRLQASIWETRAAETNLPQLRQSYLGSAAAWISRAERLEHTAAAREARLKAMAPSIEPTGNEAPAARNASTSR